MRGALTHAGAKTRPLPKMTSGVRSGLGTGAPGSNFPDGDFTRLTPFGGKFPENPLFVHKAFQARLRGTEFLDNHTIASAL